MAANQTEYFKLEQKSLIKFLVSENCKPYEIYRRMPDVYEEAYFSQKIFINGFATRNLSGKDRPWSEFPVKEKFWMQLLVKEVMLTVFWNMKGPITIDFLEKDVKVNGASYC